MEILKIETHGVYILHRRMRYKRRVHFGRVLWFVHAVTKPNWSEYTEVKSKQEVRALETIYQQQYGGRKEVN